MIYTAHYDSPAGRILLAAKDGALAGLWIEHQKYFLGSVKEEQKEQENHPVLVQAKTWLDRYFAGEKPEITELKLSPAGSEFRQAVWEILCQIPYGQVTTYGEISRKIALKSGRKQMSAQAVGGAVSHNPISIIIPCHRVVGSNGSLTGYAGGIDKKIQLLTHEGADMEGLFIPKKSTAK
ncbi:methylated-DNA--[protein]-cysteine S-methyltransferase [Anaerostipes sp.]|uniref:methylated-DNA--[protein]-cysteine S-methyltransferase n=1 Tax=Anaerostipes sp. TaxID=1872530 RepID=UPI0025C56E8E|nr:methylated-DNA--[protein]-cysteine S-methyltransferase [Anaerostipes sp.]MBS7009368.1 methylated-DNA--[protein]-cysteine S-methyltransferase [Anaerostipes sp.]